MALSPISMPVRTVASSRSMIAPSSYSLLSVRGQRSGVGLTGKTTALRVGLTSSSWCPSAQWKCTQTDVSPSAPLESKRAPAGQRDDLTNICGVTATPPTPPPSGLSRLRPPPTLARDVLMFSMFSMLAMQLFCTLLHASRMYSQKLRCPSELNQLPGPDPRVRRQ